MGGNGSASWPPPRGLWLGLPWISARWLFGTRDPFGIDDRELALLSYLRVFVGWWYVVLVTAPYTADTVHYVVGESSMKALTTAANVTAAVVVCAMGLLLVTRAGRRRALGRQLLTRVGGSALRLAALLAAIASLALVPPLQPLMDRIDELDMLRQLVALLPLWLGLTWLLFFGLACALQISRTALNAADAHPMLAPLITAVTTWMIAVADIREAGTKPIPVSATVMLSLAGALSVTLLAGWEWHRLRRHGVSLRDGPPAPDTPDRPASPARPEGPVRVSQNSLPEEPAAPRPDRIAAPEPGPAAEPRTGGRRFGVVPQFIAAASVLLFLCCSGCVVLWFYRGIDDDAGGRAEGGAPPTAASPRATGTGPAPAEPPLRPLYKATRVTMPPGECGIGLDTLLDFDPAFGGTARGFVETPDTSADEKQATELMYINCSGDIVNNHAKAFGAAVNIPQNRAACQAATGQDAVGRIAQHDLRRNLVLCVVTEQGQIGWAKIQRIACPCAKTADARVQTLTLLVTAWPA